jgi:hypothetical protein
VTTLLDFLTAGTVEYIGIIFTSIFGIVGLYGLAREQDYRRHRAIMTVSYGAAVFFLCWAIARTIGTTFMIYYQLRAQKLLKDYDHLTSTYDPLAATPHVPFFSGVYYPIIYYGIPAVTGLLLSFAWYAMFISRPRDTGLTEP